MFEEQQASIPNFTLDTNPNPNPLPPHTDASHYPCSIGFDGLQDRSGCEIDSDAASASGMISQTTDSTTCELAGGTMSETTNNGLVTPKQPESIQSFQCEVCNITCNNKDLLEKHKQGKKHSKCLQKLAESSANTPKRAPPPVASETSVGELESKKHALLQHGTSADSVYCDLCNVVCNNQEIFQKHVVGKRHSAKAVIELASKNGFIVSTPNSSGGSQKTPNTFQCGLCKITCTSNELLSMHIAGRKHLKKLKESGQIPNLPLTPNASLETPPSNLMVNPESSECKTVDSDGSNRNGKRAGSHVDVESKKQKVLQGGAALNAIRTCTLCNVVCNSPTVYLAHLAGQKHVAMVMKQAETSTTGKES